MMSKEMKTQQLPSSGLLQPRLVRPLPISGVADCPKCGCEKSVSRHNADWTCQAGCGFHELTDPDREWCRCENPGPHFHPGSRGKFCAVCGKDIQPNVNVLAPAGEKTPTKHENE